LIGNDRLSSPLGAATPSTVHLCVTPKLTPTESKSWAPYCTDRSASPAVICGATATPTHTPALQLSVVASPRASSHALPSALFVSTQLEPNGETCCRAQAEVTHSELGLHVTPAHGSVPAQAPLEQKSLTVSAKPSSHDVPSTTLEKLHVPVSRAQPFEVMHAEDAGHVTPWHRSVPWQTPVWHMSFAVPTSPSLQVVPSVTRSSLH